MLALYLFLAPLGNLVRLGDDEGSYGVTTIILAILALTSLTAACTSVFLKDRFFFLVALLIMWMGIASLFVSDTAAAYSNLAGLVVYSVVAALVFRTCRKPDQIAPLLVALVVGGFLSAAATLIDWFGVFDIPRVNEIEVATKTELGSILQASGPFARRSAMAAYFAPIIAIAFLMASYVKGTPTAHRIALYLVAVLCTIALLLTHNRAGVLSAWATILLLFVLIGTSPKRVLKLAASLLASVFAAYYVLANFFPEVWLAYSALLGIGDVATTDASLRESDNLRLILFQHALAALLDNPLGHGYTVLTGVAAYPDIDPHNTVTQIIWGAGLFGVYWLIHIALLLLRRTRVVFSRRSRSETIAQYGACIFGGGLALLLTGMTHTVISIGIGWILLGALLGISTTLRLEALGHMSRHG